MAFLQLRASEPAYLPLKDGDLLERRPPRSRWNAFCVLLLVVLAFISGTQVHRFNEKPTVNLHFAEESNLFRYNRSFTERPSDRTSAAWHSLFPPQGGYFRHPEIAPARSAFAVFHQLHCLDAIRHGYWATFDAVLAGEKKTAEDFPFMASPPHVRHCIDLIRQALMCQPDLTIEIKDEAKGGVTGFGTEHQCVSWSGLVSWVEEWETYGQNRQSGKAS